MTPVTHKHRLSTVPRLERASRFIRRSTTVAFGVARPLSCRFMSEGQKDRQSSCLFGVKLYDVSQKQRGLIIQNSTVTYIAMLGEFFGRERTRGTQWRRVKCAFSLCFLVLIFNALLPLRYLNIFRKREKRP
jgi:hypothetical protein